ncbi:unnamed protein product [Pylaiella littoralis]
MPLNKDRQIGTFKDVTSGSSRQVWDCVDVLDGCDFMVDVEE